MASAFETGDGPGLLIREDRARWLAVTWYFIQPPYNHAEQKSISDDVKADDQ